MWRPGRGQEHHNRRSARWNSETLTEDELGERQTEAKCPKCGRDLSGEAETVIKLGGHR